MKVGHEWPVRLTTFVGREQERAAVAQLLGDRRLVTLTGAGGVGKTRLALEIGSDLEGTFRDGGFFAELASVVDAAVVPQRIADALGLGGAAAAIRLFCDRARSALPSFTLSDLNAGPVAKICQRLDGIPLAIELAAARMNVLSPDEMLHRLDDRFGVLRGGHRAASSRQQTLRATLDWSYELLAQSEQGLLRRVSVFQGGWP